MIPDELSSGQAFTWSFERLQLTVSLDGDAWSVVCLSESPLRGPRAIVYESKHRQATHAAWDVLSRVSKATHDDEEGVRVALQAAQWMRTVMWPQDGPRPQPC